MAAGQAAASTGATTATTTPQMFEIAPGRTTTSRINPETADVDRLAFAAGYGVRPGRARRAMMEDANIGRGDIRYERQTTPFGATRQEAIDNLLREYFIEQVQPTLNPDAFIQNNMHGGTIIGGTPTSQYGVTVNPLNNYAGSFMDSALGAAGSYANGGYTRNQEVVTTVDENGNIVLADPATVEEIRTGYDLLRPRVGIAATPQTGTIASAADVLGNMIIDSSGNLVAYDSPTKEEIQAVYQTFLPTTVVTPEDEQVTYLPETVITAQKTPLKTAPLFPLGDQVTYLPETVVTPESLPPKFSRKEGDRVTYLPETVVTPQDGYTINRDAGVESKLLTPKQQTLPENLKEEIIKYKMKNEEGVNKARAGMVTPPSPPTMLGTRRLQQGIQVPIDYNNPMDVSLMGTETMDANAFNNSMMAGNNIPNGGMMMAADGMMKEDMEVNKAIEQYRNEMYLRNGGAVVRSRDAYSPAIPMGFGVGPSNLSESLVNTATGIKAPVTREEKDVLDMVLGSTLQTQTVPSKYGRPINTLTIDSIRRMNQFI